MRIEYEYLLYLGEGVEPQWFDEYSEINLRHVGGNWVADIDNIRISMTPKGETAYNEIMKKTQQAASASVSSTSESINNKLGGLLVYSYGGEAQRITVRGSNGNEANISPSVHSDNDTISYENVTISPDKQGLYFSVDTGWGFEPAIFYSDIKGNGVRLLKQFGGQKYISWISISPDNQQVAVELGNFVGDATIWVIPASGGEGNLIYTLIDSWIITAPVWSKDSTSLYVGTYNGCCRDYTMTFANLNLDGTLNMITQLPPILTEDTSLITDLLAISPDGKDLVYGGTKLGLFRIDAKSNAVLLEVMDPICKIAFNRDGDKLVFAESNALYTYDLKSGRKDYILDFPMEFDYTNCQHEFDWLP